MQPLASPFVFFLFLSRPLAWLYCSRGERFHGSRFFVAIWALYVAGCFLLLVFGVATVFSVAGNTGFSVARVFSVAANAGVLRCWQGVLRCRAGVYCCWNGVECCYQVFWVSTRCFPFPEWCFLLLQRRRTHTREAR